MPALFTILAPWMPLVALVLLGAQMATLVMDLRLRRKAAEAFRRAEVDRSSRYLEIAEIARHVSMCLAIMPLFTFIAPLVARLGADTPAQGAADAEMFRSLAVGLLIVTIVVVPMQLTPLLKRWLLADVESINSTA